MRRLSLLFVLLLLMPLPVGAQNLSTPVNVVVVATTDDPVGQSLVYELKERINTSSQMMLADLEDVSSGIKINIVTMDPDENERLEGVKSMYSIVWSHFTVTESGYMDMYLTQNVGFVGSDRVEGQARVLVARTSEKIDTAEAAIKNLIRAFTDMNKQLEGNK